MGWGGRPSFSWGFFGAPCRSPPPRNQHMARAEDAAPGRPESHRAPSLGAGCAGPSQCLCAGRAESEGGPSIGAVFYSRSSTREYRIRYQLYSVVYFSRECSQKKRERRALLGDLVGVDFYLVMFNRSFPTPAGFIDSWHFSDFAKLGLDQLLVEQLVHKT